MNIEKKDFNYLVEMSRKGAEFDDDINKIDSMEKKYKESSFEKIEVMEEIYKQFLKGTITETK